MATIGRAFDTAKNLWYQDVPGKGRVYDSPAAYGEAKPDIGGGLTHKDPQWDQSAGQWDAGIDWGKIYTLGTGAALGAGVLSAAGAFGAAGAGGAGGGGLTTGPVAPGAAASSWGPAGAATGGKVGFLDTAKSIYDGVNKAKGVVDTGKSLYGDLAGQVGDAAGGAAYNRAQARIQEALIQQRQDQNRLEASRLASLNTADANRFTIDKSTADIAQRKFGLEAPGLRAGNAVRGDILGHAQDATVTGGLGPNVHVPTISGGLRPSMFSDSTRQLGSLMSAQALQGQQAGDTFDPLTYQAPAPVPGLTPLPQSGITDDILTTAGAVGTGMEKFLDWLKRYQANKPPTSTPQVQGPSGLLDPSLEGGY